MSRQTTPIFRLATIDDIDRMHDLRMGVRENRLFSRDAVRRDEYVEMIERHGRGWVADEAGHIHGFSFGDARDGNIWALFMWPESERRGFGRVLHARMVDWLFGTGLRVLWLGTDPETRARRFYQTAGWRVVGPGAHGEVRMELTPSAWQAHRPNERHDTGRPE